MVLLLQNQTMAHSTEAKYDNNPFALHELSSFGTWATATVTPPDLSTPHTSAAMQTKLLVSRHAERQYSATQRCFHCKWSPQSVSVPGRSHARVKKKKKNTRLRHIDSVRSWDKVMLPIHHPAINDPHTDAEARVVLGDSLACVWWWGRCYWHNWNTNPARALVRYW